LSFHFHSTGSQNEVRTPLGIVDRSFSSGSARPSVQVGHCHCSKAVDASSCSHTPEAEERESPAYPTTAQDPARTANTAAPSGGQPNAPLIRHAGTEQPSAYKYYYVPQPGYDSAYPNPMSATSPTGYQAVAGNGNGGYFSNINWMDYVVGASSLGLVALGSALLYPNLPTWRQRAMRELSNMSSEDAARMAKTVMKAVARFSEMNNARAD